MADYARSVRHIGRWQILSTTIALAALVIASMPMPAFAAGTLSKAMVRFDRMMISTPTTGTVCAKASSTATEASVKVTFPNGYTLGTAANFAVDTTATSTWPSGATAWPSINTASNVTGQVVTFPSGDLVTTNLYCFNWTNSAAVSIQSSAAGSNTGTVATYDSTPTLIDSSNYSTASLTNDQIAVSATVPSTFSFALSANTDALGTLSTSSVVTSPTPRTVTVNTNAKNGWQVWAKDASTGLASATASYTIPSKTPGTNSTLVAGSAFYNTGLTSTQVGGTGTITIDPAFVGTAAGQGGGLDTSLRSVATSTGTADTAVLTIKNNVTIAATTAAASDYSDTITVIGAGLF